MARKLLLNNMVVSGGEDTPTATLIEDQLFCHLDAKDISLEKWNDRMGNYNFTTSSPTSSSHNRFNLEGYTATSTNFTFGSFPFTLEFTVSITATTSWGNLFSNTNISLFQINHRNNGYYGIKSSHMSPTTITQALATSKVNDGTLHILDFVFVSSTHLIVYLDGVKQSDITTSTFKDTMLGLVGYQLGATGGVIITGYVYSFRLYRKALSELEIRSNCIYEATQERITTITEEEQINSFTNKWK